MIVFYNPHVDDFLAEPPHFKLLRRRALKKYGFVIEKTLEQGNRLLVVIDGTISAFISDRYFSMLPRNLRQCIAIIEFALWKKINRLSGKVRRIDVASENLIGMALLMFSYKGATGRLFSERVATLSSFNTVVAHLSHYFILTAEKSRNLSRLASVWLAGDSDISANPYFQNYFNWYHKPFLILPFAVASRFMVRKPFSERAMRCIATGSFHNLDEEVPRSSYADFQKFFNINTYHPVRKMIYEQAAKTDGVIVSRVSPYRGKSSGGLIKRWLKHFSVSQKDYFSIDIVDLYNSNRYVLVGEEVSGFPALGSFEAMACGSVLIADKKYYEGLGIVVDEHYVVHDGTIEGILSAIRRVKALSDGGEEIAALGKTFVEAHFRPEPAYARWCDVIAGIVEKTAGDHV